VSEINHPFVPNARVAIISNSDEVKEARVGKLYKSGNFVLEGSTQQYRPYKGRYDKWWRARPTGEFGYSRRESVWIWDEGSDADIHRMIETSKLSRRFNKVRDRFYRMAFNGVTAEALDAIESGIAIIDAQVAALRQSQESAT
jgi:hypothetical protein